MIYARIENGRQVFSTCEVIRTSEGVWISNPTSEQIAAEGWAVYEPPILPPQPQTEPEMDAVMQAVKTLLSTETTQLSDEDALAVAAAFPAWVEKIGKPVNQGERYWYDGRLWKVLQAHTAQEEWTPDTAMSLFVEVSIVEWPEWVQPTGAQDAYNTGDKVTYNGQHYISLIDNNTWSPEAYPQGWEVQP